MKGIATRLALAALVLVSACTTDPVPSRTPTPVDLLPTVRLPVVFANDAPGKCAQTTQFAYVGISTLTQLGFGQSEDLDYRRPGKFWITYGPISTKLPGVPAKRMLCVTWLDGRSEGLQAMDVPDAWPEVILQP
jgi:hypothetical protein